MRKLRSNENISIIQQIHSWYLGENTVRDDINDVPNDILYCQLLIEIKYTSTSQQMFRVTRLLQLTKPLLTPTSLFFSPSSLVFKSLSCFSQQTKKQILQMVEKGKVEQNLDKILIDIAFLNEGMKEEVLTEIVEHVQIGRLPPTILAHEKFDIQLKRHPALYFQAYFFLLIQNINKFSQHVSGQDKKLKKAMNQQISEFFKTCFQSLKKIQAKIAAPKEIQLLRTFANYNYFFLAKLVDPTREQQCINKSRQNYKSTLTKCGALLKSLLKEEEQLMSKTNPKQKPQQKQKRQAELKKQFNDLKFQVAERYGQVVFEILNIEDQQNEKSKLKQEQLKQLQAKKKKQVKNQVQQQVEFQMGKETLALQPFILQAIKNFDLIPHRMVESKCYYKLRKLHLQVQNQIKIRKFVESNRNKKQAEKDKQLLKIELQIKSSMDSLYDDALKKLQQIKSQELDAEVLSQHIMVILSTKIQQFFVDQGEQTSLSSKDIAKQVEKLVGCIFDQQKRKRTLAHLILKVKSTFNVKIDSYVEKVPRNLRTQRRKKSQQL